jgi:hypothetical protein
MSDLKRAAERRNVRRFAKNAERMTKAFGAASAPEGHAIVQRHVGRLTEWITGDRAVPGRSMTPALLGLLRGVPDDEIAQAALAGVLNSIRRPPKDDDKGLARIAKEIIGAEIERAVRGYRLRTEHPALFKKIERAAAYGSNLRDRLTVERKKLREAGLKLKWTGEQRLVAGNWGFDACLQALPDVIVERLEGKDRVPAIAEAEWRSAGDIATWLMHRQLDNTPTLLPPSPWIEFENDAGIPFLLGCRDEDAARAASMRPHMDAVSYLQSMPLTIDGYMLDFVQKLAAWNWVPLIGIGSGKRDKGPRELLRWDLEQANLLWGKTFYLPLACEWRGRLQPLPYFHYARADHIRSLFRLAHGEPIGERGLYWLKVSTANCFDEKRRIARLPFDDRVAWVDENLWRIRMIADHPWLGLKPWATNSGKPWLEEAADPFQFISHARELVAAIDAGPDFVTTLPLPLDASNSGAQHYAMLARDPVGARLTNLTFDGKVRCLYEEVGKIIENNFAVLFDEGSEADRRRVMWWIGQDATDRKTIKGLSVPYLYGQSAPKAQGVLLDILRDRQQNQIADGFVDAGQQERKWRRPKKDDFPKGYRKWFIEKHRTAIEAAFPGLKPTMDFFRNCAEMLAERGEVLRWTSPSGVPVCNRYNEPDEHRKSYYLGAKRVQHVGAYAFRPELDQGGCRRGAPPNVVHSLDASHLAFTVLACECEGIPLLTVHDCFATLGCHVDALRAFWLRELVTMYENADMLKQMHDYTKRMIGRAPDIPQPRGLDLRAVNGPYALA